MPLDEGLLNGDASQQVLEEEEERLEEHRERPLSRQ